MRDMEPGTFDKGFGFDYQAWEPDTIVELLNVEWSSDYQDGPIFESVADRTAYFNGKSSFAHVIRKMTYCRPGEPIRVSIPFHNAYKYNYIRVRQRQSHVNESPKDIFYFIQDVRHVAPNTTELTLMIDVWTTFQLDVILGRAYIEQGHVGIAQRNNFKGYGREFLMEPEGLELGAEMVTLSSDDAEISNLEVDGTMDYDILVWSNTLLHNSWGDAVKNPVMNSASGTYFQRLPQAASCYLFKSVGEFLKFTRHLSYSPHVAQGIIAVHVIPNGLIDDKYLVEESYDLVYDDSKTIKGKVLRIDNLTEPSVNDILLHDNFRSYMSKYMGERYAHLKKFMTAPYAMVELTTYTGAPLMLRPECINTRDISVRRFADLGLPSPRVVMTPKMYNFYGDSWPAANSNNINRGKGMVGDFLDVQTGIYNFPSLSILNNSYLAYMSANAHSIAFQHSAAEWSQDKALQSNQLSFDQSSAGIALNSEMNSLNNQQQIIGTGINAATGIVGGAINGGVRGGIGGAVVGAGAGAIGGAVSAANTANSVVHNNMRTGASNANAAYVRDTNKAYADFAAKGDYAQSIAAINAKAQDMKVVAPTTMGQVGGEQFALLYLQWRIFAKVKMLQPGAMRAIGEYWLRYGYKVNRFMSFGGGMSQLHVMTKFSYWRMSEVYLRASNCPESYRMAIRGILTKGITVWKNPDEIGMVDPGDNKPIVGDYI